MMTDMEIGIVAIGFMVIITCVTFIPPWLHDREQKQRLKEEKNGWAYNPNIKTKRGDTPPA